MTTVADKSAGQEAEVRAMIDKYFDTWNRHDIAANSLFFDPQADFVNVVGQKLHGREAIERSHQQLHRTIFRDIHTRLEELAVSFLAPEIALVHARWQMTGAQQLPGWNVPKVRTGIFTMVLVNNGGWQIRAFHNTDTIDVPALPKT